MSTRPARRIPEALVLVAGPLAAFAVPVMAFVGGFALRPLTFGGDLGYLPSVAIIAGVAMALVITGLALSIAAIRRRETRTLGITLTAVIGALLLVFSPLGLFLAVYGDPARA